MYWTSYRAAHDRSPSDPYFFFFFVRLHHNHRGDNGSKGCRLVVEEDPSHPCPRPRTKRPSRCPPACLPAPWAGSSVSRAQIVLRLAVLAVGVVVLVAPGGASAAWCRPYNGPVSVAAWELSQCGSSSYLLQGSSVGQCGGETRLAGCIGGVDGEDDGSHCCPARALS